MSHIAGPEYSACCSSLLSCCSKRRPKDLGWPNAWVVGLALLLTIPFVAAQTVTAWMSVIIPGHEWEHKRAAGTYMLSSFVDGTASLCDNSGGKV